MLPDLTLPFSVIPFAESTASLADGGALQRQAGEQGYLCFRGLVDAFDIARLRKTCIAAADRQGWLAAPGTDRAAAGVRLLDYEDTNYINFLQEVLVSEPFNAVRRDPAIRHAVEAAMGKPAVPREADICRVFSPGTPELSTGPHQDFHYVGEPAAGWTVWLPLGDCPLSLGPIAILAGSHKRGPLQHAGDGMTKCVAGLDAATWSSGPLSAGDAVLFHSLTVHRSLPNLSDGRLRFSADFRFVPAQ